MLLVQGGIEGCSLQRFEEAAGLSLTLVSGTLKEDLPPITTFLNRLLALPIALKNTVFTAFDDLLNSRIAEAIAEGNRKSDVAGSWSPVLVGLVGGRLTQTISTNCMK